MNKGYEVRLSRAASRALAEQLPLGVASAIWAFLTGPLADNPRRLGKPLSGQLAGCHSARRGSYRVVYIIAENPAVITVLRIDHRRHVYHGVNRSEGTSPPLDQRPRRVRELGIAPGRHRPGPRNSITDLRGVRVGHTTVDDGAGLRTGVTAVVPDALDVAGGQLRAGLFVGNGYGKLVGATQIVELGVVETPILLTGTLSAFRAADALVSYVLGLPGNEETQSVNPVVGETNDGYLSDIRRRPITEQHVLDALSTARTDTVAEGCVGAGTGTGALGFKAGIGTSSRVVHLPDVEAPCTVGVLLQSNFSGTLSVLGVAIEPAAALGEQHAAPVRPGNSCMIVVATDCGLDARQLGRVARRAVFGLGRAGSDFAPNSGDYGLAFDVGGRGPVPETSLGPVFDAVQESVEEAVLNSVFMAVTTVGYRGHTNYAVPHEFVIQRCREAGVSVSPTS